MFRFTDVWSSGGIYYGATGDSPGSLLRRVAFLPPPTAAPPPQLTLPESWRLPGGVYVFLGETARDDIAFVRQLDDYLDWEKQVGLLWVENPNLPFKQWRAMPLRLGAHAAASAPIVADALVSLDNYAIEVAAGSTLKVDFDNVRYLLAGQLAIRVTTEQPVSLPIVQGDVRIDIAAAGLLGCRLAPRGAKDTAALDIGFRFYFPGTEPLAVGSLFYPLLAGEAALDIAATLDPFAPLDPSRSALSFEAPSDPLATFYRTSAGGPLGLTPREGARLLFAVRPHSLAPVGNRWLTLVADGRFEVRYPAGSAPQLRCGLSGAEYFLLPANAAVAFVPGAAWAPLDDARKDTPLLDSATTAWARIVSSDDVPYFAQPDGAGLYGPSDASGILPFAKVPAGSLPGAAGPSVPLPPYAGIDPRQAGDFRRVEAGALSTARRAIVFQRSPERAARRRRQRAEPPDPPVNQPLVTPQGFVATFGDHGAWSSLRIARHGDQYLEFTGVHDPLRSALLTNQQFLVISKATVLAGFTGHRLVLDGWVFDLDPARWAEHGTIAIIKNCPQSLRSLIDSQGSWTLGPQLNDSPAATQATLKRIVADADAALPNPDYTWFVNTVLDTPGWNGVLFLNVPVATDGHSSELDAVVAATDPRRLKAHHLGLGPTPSGGVPIAMKDSSLFGLIRYRDQLPGPEVISTDELTYQVLEIKVLFHNSVIASFVSRIALIIRRFFGAAARQRDGATTNALLLIGSYQQRPSGPAYVFMQDVPTTFDLAESPLAAVAFDRCEFAAAPDRGTGGPIATTFSFWGALRFRRGIDPGGGLDLLSYDALAFAGLALSLEFPRATPAEQTFALDVGAVRFDPATSVTRAGAFADHFPVQPRGMTSWVLADSPGALGFMTVRISVPTSRLGGEWYGLVYDLKLGTVGDLAAGAGLVASLCVAWCAGAGTPMVSAGLKLPGSAGASSTIGIQGVLALNIFSIALTEDEGYALTLNGITLTFMKKKLPPGAAMDLFLFGDPETPGGALGWYGAYRKTKPGPADPLARRIETAERWRRALPPGD